MNSVSHDTDWLGQRDDRLVFGLGAHAAPARLKVSWPSGVVTVVEDANLLASHVNSMSRPLRCWEEGPPRATRAATTRATPTGDHKGDPKA